MNGNRKRFFCFVYICAYNYILYYVPLLLLFARPLDYTRLNQYLYLYIYLLFYKNYHH